MKLTELHSKLNNDETNTEICQDGRGRYYIKHVPKNAGIGGSGRYEIIDRLDPNETPIQIYQYNSLGNDKEVWEKAFAYFTALNAAETVSEDEKKDMSELPPEIIKDLEKNIRKGASDLTQKWANALELVHKAYEVGYEVSTTNAEGKKEKASKPVQRPTPSMTGGWKQYEDLIKYAVEQLAKSRGIQADWRMSSSKID